MSESNRGKRTARRHARVGSVVADDRGQVVLIERDVLRDGRWIREVRLPKGRARADEPDGAAALAEARRLTRFRDLEVLADLGRGLVEYVSRGVRLRRQEHYFLLRLLSEERLTGPAPDEDARLYRVVVAESFEEAARQLSFESEQSAMLRARAWWPNP